MTGPDGREYGVRFQTDENGVEICLVEGRRLDACEPRQLWDVDLRLRTMDAAGVDVQALSVPPFLLLYNLEPSAAAACARRLNEGIASVVARHPDRFAGLATVPLQDTDLALAALDHATGSLGMRGVEICSNVAGENLDAPRLLPFFERVAQLKLPIFIHPHNVAGRERLQSYYLSNLIGNPVDTTIAAASLVFGGVLEKLPDLCVILAHGGGATPYICGRWQHGWERRGEPKGRITGDPLSSVRRLYFDSITHGEPALRFLVDTFGADHVVLGTDYPFDMGDEHPVQTLTSLGLSSGQTEKMLGGTLARLLGLDVR